MNKKPKILIVDDRPENLVTLRRVLRDLDVVLVEATNGNDALKETLHHDFALARRNGEWEQIEPSRYVSDGKAVILPSYEVVTLSGAYTFESNGPEIQVFAAINNLFDEEPPIVGGTIGQTQPGTYDILGRYYYLGVQLGF